MSVQSLLNQTATLYSQSSYNAQGREVVGATTTVKSRIQAKKRTRLTPTGAMFQIDAVAFFMPSVTIAIDDKVTFSSQNYKVTAIYPVPDGQGNTDHIEAELMLWQAT